MYQKPQKYPYPLTYEMIKDLAKAYGQKSLVQFMFCIKSWIYCLWEFYSNF